MSAPYDYMLEASKIMSSFYDAISEAYRDKVGELENCIVTNDMIREHGSRLLDSDGKTILCWKGLPVVEWDALPMSWSEDGQRAIITFRK